MMSTIPHATHTDAYTVESDGQALGPQMQQQIAQARQRRKAIDRAMSVAAFDAWSSAVLAALCVPFALFSWASLLAAMVLSAVAYVEFTGRAMLRQLDPRSLHVLAGNQIGMAVIVILYAVWRLYLATTGQGYAAQIEQQLPPDVAGQLGSSVSQLVRNMEMLVYVVLIAGTVLMQGGTALYYLSRRKALHEFVTQTPRWVIDVLKAAA
ncbi:MAG: hypothetical protein IT445_20355 [Phycisphaeraceae bacterium]|nr:hypothetical protein [Phycisphaeraceae bacterium]